MKALVRSGGSGTRPRPVTHTSARQSAPVANKPPLCCGLEAIAAAGITEAAIIVGDTAEEARKAVGDGSESGIEVTSLRQEAPLSLTHAVLIARDFRAEDDFLMCLGGNAITGGIPDGGEEFRAARPDARVLPTRVPDPSCFCGAGPDAAGRVVRLTEEPRRSRSDPALVGVCRCAPDVHEAVRAIQPPRRGEHATRRLVLGDFGTARIPS